MSDTKDYRLLDGKDRSQGRLLLRPYISTPSEIYQIPVEREGVSVQFPSTGSTGIHKVVETASFISHTSGMEADYFLDDLLLLNQNNDNYVDPRQGRVIIFLLNA